MTVHAIISNYKGLCYVEKTLSNNKMVNNFETSRIGNVNIYKFGVWEVLQKSDKCEVD